jgi:hypothetical protein
MIYLQLSILTVAIIVFIALLIVDEDFRNLTITVIIPLFLISALVAVVWSAMGVWDYYAHPSSNIPAQVEREGKGTQ